MKFDECVSGRRSIRKYLDKEVSMDMIKEMINAAIMAPSWKNSQVTRYYISADKETTKDFLPCLPEFNQKNIQDAPVVIVSTVVKNISGFDRDGGYSTHLKDGWQYFDCGLEVENLCLKAYDLGLGTLIMGIYDADKVREFFNIPPTEEITAVIGVGYPDVKPEMPKRKTFDNIATIKKK